MDNPYTSIAQMGADLRSGKTTAVHLAQAHLDRIAELNPKFHPYITVATEHALQQARTADEQLKGGEDLGPLHGIPVAVKDLFATAGIRTTGHSFLLRDWVPTFDATVVRRLYEAGGVLLGKLALHEFADGGAYDGPFPAARNPWGEGYSPGGSSSGSAVALAAGMVAGSVGSDTGFSARGPASWCNVVGLKPTYGLVSRAGGFPLAWTIDHMCPMARTVEDCAYVFQAVAGYDPADATSLDKPVPDVLTHLRDGVQGLRVGVPRDWFKVGRGVDDDVLAVVEAALETLRKLGCTVVDIDSEVLINAVNIQRIIRHAEAYNYHEHTLMTNPGALGPSLTARLVGGDAIRGIPYAQALIARLETIDKVEAIFGGVDVMVTPVSPRRVPTFQELIDLGPNYYSPPNFVNPFNLTGHPGVSVPCGFDSRGMPVGMHIVGPMLADDRILRAAYAYEQAMPWKDRHPEV